MNHLTDTVNIELKAFGANRVAFHLPLFHINGRNWPLKPGELFPKALAKHFTAFQHGCKLRSLIITHDCNLGKWLHYKQALTWEKCSAIPRVNPSREATKLFTMSQSSSSCLCRTKGLKLEAGRGDMQRRVGKYQSLAGHWFEVWKPQKIFKKWSLVHILMLPFDLLGNAQLINTCC